MKKILHILAGVLLSASLSQQVLAQQTGLGVRLTPDGVGITGKTFIGQSLAFEGQWNAGGLFHEQGRSYTVAGLLEYHIALPDPRWRVFFGGGLHAGSWKHDKGNYSEAGVRNTVTEAIFGIDGIGGAEYVLKSAPIGFSVDFKPAINLLSEVDFFPHNMFGVSVRYYFR